ncbi:hypothetical protein RN001_009958 [Aquatica leii]|uniref:Uncharacterized protein n=1 Tax=Aquatica leii TaxID=1421715 RepID=A0AAN7P5W7_9COLE|nr:hypothetical protein RN001_009958 [Aquatica leii]
MIVSHNSKSTLKEVPLYMRQSWLKVTDPIRTACICESGVNPTIALKSVLNTEVPNNPCLKCFFKCLAIKLNFMEATTGDFLKYELLRQVEGMTTEIFDKCNDKIKSEEDLCKKAFNMYMCLVHYVSEPKKHYNMYNIKLLIPFLIIAFIINNCIVFVNSDDDFDESVTHTENNRAGASTAGTGQVKTDAASKNSGTQNFSLGNTILVSIFNSLAVYCLKKFA